MTIEQYTTGPSKPEIGPARVVFVAPEYREPKKPHQKKRTWTMKRIDVLKVKT